MVAAHSQPSQPHTAVQTCLQSRSARALSGHASSASDPRSTRRGFSFGVYWFGFFYFSSAPPDCAGEPMMPG